MDRNREARRASMAATNGLSRRRHRSSNLRDSPEEDVPVELQETARLRERKKDRDRDRERSSRSKRRRGDRLMHGSNREDGGDESTEESVNDDEEEDEDDGGGGGGGVRMLPPNPAVPLYSSSSLSNHYNQQHQQQLQHRKTFPPVAAVTKVFRPAQPWKAADEMIGVSVPRKARSASTKRSHECWLSSGGGGSGVIGEQINRQASTSPVRPSLVSAPSPSPVSPSSSNISVRKKLKPNGPKHRPPLKSSSKSSSSNQDEIEIEIAEVLYGMMRQPQGPSKQEIMGTNDSMKFDSREVNKTTTGDAKSRVSSPISNSPSVVPPQSAFLIHHNSSSPTAPMTAVAPKRKKPRPVSYNDENPPIFAARNNPTSSIIKAEIDQSAKMGTSSLNLEKNSGSVVENGGVLYDLPNSQLAQASSESQPVAVKAENGASSSDSKLLTEELAVALKEEEAHSPKKDSPRQRFDENCKDSTATKANLVTPGIETKREEKFQIDLMAPPFQTRSSPERDSKIDCVAVETKPIGSNVETERKLEIEEDRDDSRIAESEEVEMQRPIVNKERFIDLQLDMEKNDSGNKLSHAPKHQQLHPKPKTSRDEAVNTEKTAQSSGSLPLPISMGNWPGGLPPMGYMAPLQGVVSMDGSTVSSSPLQPPHLLFSQPRPKRCATHCYIARNIHCHQQFTRMNSFWPAAAGSASLYGPKACNLNVMPSSELHGNIQGRGVNSVQDKGQVLAMFPGHAGKDKGSQAANIVDAAQRKQQILLQQPLPQGAPNNILHGPTFLFPLGQPQAAAAAAASVRPGSLKSPATGASVSSTVSNSASVSASATGVAAAAATAMSFNYPNITTNDAPYLAILQNSAYPFPIPAHVGGPAAYRGTHAQAVPFFNGSFYSSQMLLPSQQQQQLQHQHQQLQLQHQQQQLQHQQLQQQQQKQKQQQPPPQTQQLSQGHQNASISSGSSSSQKHLQNLQQRPQGNGINSGSGCLQSFSATKHQPSQQLLQQQSQRLQLPHQTRQLDNEVGGEDSPSTADSRVSRANMSVYGQNFALPIHPQNFALTTHPVSMGAGGGNGGGGASGNPSEKKHQQPQHQGLKVGVESLPSPAFAMSFASFSGAANSPGLDISSMAQNHTLIQNFPEAARHGYPQMMAAHASQVAQQKKNFRSSEEGKTGGGDSSNVEEERKSMTGKTQASGGQSIAFSRSDLTDTSGTTIPGNTVIDSSARSLNLGAAPARTSSSVMPVAMSSIHSPNSQQRQQQPQQQQHQLQQQQHQHQQQIIQLQKQQSHYAARNKMPATSNGNVYSDHPPSSSTAAKFSNAHSAFPQNLVQSSGSPSQSPHWKNSARTTTSQVPCPSIAASSTSTLKNLPQQQQGRAQQTHTQISFTGNPKSSTAPQGQQLPNTSQAPSPPMAVGSPTTSSISKGAGGSPRTATSTSTGNKAGQASTLSPQQGKSSPSVPRKSSPVGGRTAPSILGNPQIVSSSGAGTKPQLQQQQLSQQQNQLNKQAMQQAQLFFSNPYMQTQAPNSTNTSSATGGYYTQRRRPEQHHHNQQQQPQGSSATSSTGMLSPSPPVTLASASTSDPAKAVAAAASAGSNLKGGGLPSQGILNAAQFAVAQSSGNLHQLVPAGYSYLHAVPTAVQVKQAEQKKPARE